MQVGLQELQWPCPAGPFPGTVLLRGMLITGTGAISITVTCGWVLPRPPDRQRVLE